MRKYLDNLFQYRYLLEQLVLKGIKLKYRSSYLGVLWSLLEPLLTMIVLTIVFGTLYDNRTSDFAVYILCGRLLYTFFSASTKECLKSIRKNRAMIKKVYVPKYLYPLSATLSNYIIFLISLIVLVGVCIFFRVFPTIYIFQVFIPLALLPVLAYGCGMILATIGVYFRDMQYLWNVIMMIIMYTCAIFYDAEKILESGFGWILRINPVFALIQVFRAGVLGAPMEMYYVIYAAVFSFASLVVGLILFKKSQDNFILHI